MRVLVNIPLSPYTGYGNDGIGLCRTLIEAGHDVSVIPDAVQAPLPVDIAMLLTKPLQGEYDLAIVHLTPSGLKASHALRSISKVLIGWTMWEWSNFDREDSKTVSEFRDNWKAFDAIVCYDDASQAALRPYYDGPMPIVQGGFLPDDWPEVERDYFEKNFYFCMVGLLSPRKNPFVAIQAMAELKEEHPEEMANARLSLKTVGPGLHSKMETVWPWLRVYYEEWPTDTLRAFYASQHVLLAPSRGEGKNMPALEFQSTGGTVIATNYGGHKQWLNPELNYALDYELVASDAYYPDTYDAEASKKHLKELILHIMRNRGEAAEKGRLAAHVIPAQSRWSAVVDRLFDRLKEEVPGGDVVHMKHLSTDRTSPNANR